jgi:hypothetical protein
LTEKNNNTWQIKCRKPTKNYKFWYGWFIR